jgi:capsid assembly protease
MKFERVSRILYATPWAIKPEVYMAFHSAFQAKIEGRKVEIFGEEMEYDHPDDYEVINGVAVIRIHGALGHRISDIDKACMGAVDYLDIQSAIEKAENDQSVSSILLHISSPGGMVTGLPETAQRIADASKPTVAFTDDLAASAGYYLACSCDSIYATHSAQVGCIGTLMTWIDVSAAYEMQGVKRELVASGKYKGMLMPGMPLTDDQRALLYSEVNKLSDEFKAHVISNRGPIDAAHMEGQTLWGNDARTAHLVDEIGLFEDALTEAADMAAELE